MRYITFGGWRLSKVGLGTSQFANPGWGYGADYSPQDLVRQALALGVNHFDTTDIYGAGASQRILGTSLSGIEGVLVATSLFNVAPSSRLVVARAGRALDAWDAGWTCATCCGPTRLSLTALSWLECVGCGRRG